MASASPIIDWTVQPDAEKTLRIEFAALLDRCPPAKAYAQDLLSGCGVRLRDILDHIRTDDQQLVDTFVAGGWQEDEPGLYRNRTGFFPAVVHDQSGGTLVYFRVESLAQFLAARAINAPIEGALHSPARSAIVFNDSEVRFGVFERSGHIGFDIPEVDAATIRTSRLHLQHFRARRRHFDTVEQGLEHTERLVDAAVADLSPHWACHLWLQAEREYWMLRCSAGRLQKLRQDQLGIGWSNIDHHTYDGSRQHYRHTIRILEKLGYERREMIYAGELAGWGSQVLEQPALQSTIFADVDLAPHEVGIDFAHEELPELDRHRRAGLLSLLHGESILEAGLNHVAAMYDQKELRGQLAAQGLQMMQPFSNMPHLYQELTLGDWAPVDPARVDQAEREGHIGPEEAEKVRLEGAIISHLENIERNDGYKGFNKPGIDGVLRKLDPRAYQSEDAVAAE
jgi:hypothetical protein